MATDGLRRLPPRQRPSPRQAPYVIEGARSSRSKCKTCRKKIEKGVSYVSEFSSKVRTASAISGITSRARRSGGSTMSRPPTIARSVERRERSSRPDVPPALEEMRKMHTKRRRRSVRSSKKIPYAEVDPSGRAKCKHCGDKMEKGSYSCGARPGDRVRDAVPYDADPRASVACVAGRDRKSPIATPASEGFEGVGALRTAKA